MHNIPIWLIFQMTQAVISSLFAPALIDFKYMFRTSMNNVSYVNFFKGMGYMIGSLGKSKSLIKFEH